MFFTIKKIIVKLFILLKKLFDIFYISIVIKYIDTYLKESDLAFDDHLFLDEAPNSIFSFSLPTVAVHDALIVTPLLVSCNGIGSAKSVTSPLPLQLANCLGCVVRYL